MKSQISNLKSQNYNFILKKSCTAGKFKILAFCIMTLSLAFLLFSLAPWALGESPTPEASPAAKKTLDEKVKDIREAVKGKVQEKLAEVRKGQKRAFVGKISDITNSTLVLDTRQGEKQVRAGDETTIIGLGRKEIEFEDLEIGSFAIAMGYLEETGILDARRIVIVKKPKTPARLVAFGEVTDKSTEEKILTVKHPKKGTIYEVEATNTTKITKKIEGKIEKVKFDEIEIGDRLVAIGTPAEENNFLTAKLIHVIPASPAGRPEKATEQQSPTPSPQASPSPSLEE